MEGTSAAALTPEMALTHLGADCRAIHVGTLGLVLQPLANASIAVIAHCGGDQLVMVDPNCRPSVMTTSPVFRGALAAVLPRADLVKVSGDDLAFLFPDLAALAAAVRLQQETGAVVLFTDGAKSVHVIGPGTDVVLDVPKVPVVDTVGAGDSFSGGFLAHWMHNGLGRADVADIGRVVEAARFGIAVAGITCQRPGADPPHSHEVPGGWA
jgi:fructokinase